MRRILVPAITIALIVAFVGFAYTMNPADVDFRISPTMTHRIPLGFLLVGAMVVGALLAVFAVLIQQINQRMATWAERRKARNLAQIEELNESGAALAWDGEIERSRSILKKAWRRDPHNKQAALALAACYSDTGEYEAAQTALEAAVAEDASDPDLRYALGEALRQGGRSEDAIRMHETLRVQYPHAPRVLVSLRELYSQAQRWKDAAGVQEQYISELSRSDGIHAERDRLRDFHYRAALQIENPTERITALEALLDEHRDFSPALNSIGDAMVDAGREGEAQKTWERAFKKKADLLLAEKMLAHQDSSSGRQRVVSLVNKYADQLDPDGVKILRANASLSDGALDAAQQELEGIADSTLRNAQRAWADLYEKRGEGERAWQTLRPLAS